VVSYVKLLFGDMEVQPEMSSAVKTPEKLERLKKCVIRSQNKRTIYNVYKILKDFLSNLNSPVILMSTLNR
jgi:hypothetical protein